MEIGTIVKVHIPYKRGEKKEKQQERRYKVGKVVGIYPNFILIEFKAGYKACYRECELIII